MNLSDKQFVEFRLNSLPTKTARQAHLQSVDNTVLRKDLYRPSTPDKQGVSGLRSLPDQAVSVAAKRGALVRIEVGAQRTLPFPIPDESLRTRPDQQRAQGVPYRLRRFAACYDACGIDQLADVEAFHDAAFIKRL